MFRIWIIGPSTPARTRRPESGGTLLIGREDAVKQRLPLVDGQQELFTSLI